MRNEYTEKLDVSDFAYLFGTTADDFPEVCRELIRTGDFRYKKLNQSERDRLMFDIIKKLDSGEFSPAGPGGKARWDKEWRETLERFLASNGNLETLRPRYFRTNQAVRLWSDYVLPLNPQFELEVENIFKHWIFRKYFGEAEHIYEFGCGSGWNLTLLAGMFPHKEFHGLDWAAASGKIVETAGQKYGWKMRGEIFDMFSPPSGFSFKEKSAVLCFSALEQLGAGHRRFTEFLLKAKPAIVAQVDYFNELYRSEELVDYLGMRFADQRNYLRNYLTHLRQLESEGRIVIEKVHRAPYGNLYFDGKSYAVWRPLT